MKSLLTNIPFLVGIVLLVGLASVAASLFYGDWVWFQRSGSITVLVGVVLGGRRAVRRGIRGLFYDATHDDYGHIKPTPDETESDRQLKQDIWAAYIGIGLAVLGTIIGGYGDLLNRLLASQ